MARVACLGAISGVYQFMGGDLSALTGGYVTSRGEAMRFMTLLGEPNVGGMASSIILLAAVYIVRNQIWKTGYGSRSDRALIAECFESRVGWFCPGDLVDYFLTVQAGR